MEYRTLGRTGVKVSPLCLGAMMFGAWGNPDHDESIAVIHAALDAGINFIDTADVYSAGESEEIVAKAHRRAGATTSCSPPRFYGAMGADPNMAGGSRRWIIRECENSLRRLEHRLHRPVPDAPARARHRHRRDARRADRPRAPGQGALPRQLDVPGVGDRRGAVGGRAAPARAVRVRAAAVLDPRPRHRGRRAARRASATAWA